MTTRLTFPASMFSVVCQRCGSTLRKNADSCPNCGADRAAAFGEERTKERVKEPSGMFSMASASGPLASEAAAPSDWAKADTRSQAEPGADPDVLPESEGWNHRKTAIAAVCAVGLIAGGVAYLMHDNTDEEPAAASTQHSASGSIDSKSGGYVQNDSPPISLPPAVAAAIDRKAPADSRPLSTGDAVLAARGAMEQHDLTAARTRLKGISPQLQSRPDVQRLKDELAQHELERDAALQLARACEKTSAWACVQQNAGEALAIDGSNTESQAMLERVITHAGWLAGTPPIAALKKKAAPAGVPAPTVAVTPPATPPVTSATEAIMSAIPSPAPAPSAVLGPAPAPAPAPQAKVAAAKPAAAAPKPSTAAAQPAEARATARESRRSSAYARSAPATDTSMNSVKVMPAPAISPPMLSTSPSTASVHVATPPAAMVPATTGPKITTTTAAMTPPPVVATAPATVPATAPPSAMPKTPSYANAQAPVRAATVLPAAPAAVATTAPIRAAATYGASSTDTPTTGNADDIERAIKQFGWSGGDSMPKAAR